MDNFDIASAFTFRPDVEGGYVVDHAGPTNYGVTQTTLDNYLRKTGSKEKLSVKDMGSDTAYTIARDMYYDSVGLGNLPTKVGVAAFDYGYNSGTTQAIKDLQRVVGVKADGIYGNQTHGAIMDYVAKNGEDALVGEYIGRRRELMQKLIAKDPEKYGQYADGWENRLNNLSEYLNAVGMVGGGESSAGGDAQ